MEPLVSVIIPTYHRPELVKRAVKSALAQTLDEIEVIVVIDGPHPETRAALSEINSPRLKVIELPQNQGCCAARNAGIAAACGEWIALLDDDDEWMPEKLDLQLAMAKASSYQYPIVSCYLIARTLQGDTIWPRRQPKKLEPISEYLFVRSTLFQGEGVIQTSTIFTKRELLQQFPHEGIKTHEDWDWVLRVMNKEGVGVEFVELVLSIWHLEEVNNSLSRSINWRTSLNWIKSKRDLVTPRAYSSFLFTQVSAHAADVGDWKGLFILLLEAFRNGKPQPIDVCVCLGMWLFPWNIRGWLRTVFQARHKFFFLSSQS
jgi:glycosyltransferase involved in cell wall biosynthesis